MMEGWREILSAWKHWRVEAEEYRELGGGRVPVFLDFSARGKASGLAGGGVWTKGASLYQLCDGTVTRLALYWDRVRALADLAPEAGSQHS
jgi:hypothetical protein